MLIRHYYSCGCGWETERGNVEWGLIELAEVPSQKHVMKKCGECGGLYRDNTDIIVYLCPVCSSELLVVSRGLKNDNAPEVIGTPYKKPIHSDALALTPANVTEHKEKFPDIEIDDQNRPVFTNTKQHQEYLDKIGARKQVQKTGRSKGKIYSIPGGQCS
jgi:DNA-directed RNA polymerase subunit RPC12/RpoP